MYFMQESGQALKLSFTKGPYGPYAENLRHVLTHIEGHFIVGYGDAADKPDKAIEPKAHAVAAAEEFLKDHPKVHERFDRVVNLIEGFETPFGMELLSTVHWVATREGANMLNKVAERTYSWNDRKRMFSSRHLRVALDVLKENGWIKAPARS
jgi:hypothetical protein